MSEFANTPVWSRTGSPISPVDGSVIPSELLFTISKRPSSEAPGAYTLVREETGYVISSVGARYEPFQPKDMYKYALDYFRASGGVLVRAGYNPVYHSSWALGQYHTLEAVKGDPVTFYKLFVNPYTTGTAFTISTLALREESGSCAPVAMFSLPHYGTLTGKLEAASFDHSAECAKFGKALGKMARKKVTPRIEGDYTRALFDVSGPVSKVIRGRMALYKELLTSGLGSEVKPATVYNMYFAALEYADHFHPIQRDDDNTRLQSMLFGAIYTFKRAAYDIALSYL